MWINRTYRKEEREVDGEIEIDRKKDENRI